MLGSDIAIGANAVVNKSFNVDGITLAGVPAKIVANHGSQLFDATKFVDQLKKQRDF